MTMFKLYYRIEKMVKRDEGEYRCQATTSRGMFHAVRRNITFDCARPTEVEIHRPDGDLYSLQTKLLWKCEATGSPAPTYAWFKDGSRIGTGAPLT